MEAGPGAVSRRPPPRLLARRASGATSAERAGVYEKKCTISRLTGIIEEGCWIRGSENTQDQLATPRLKVPTVTTEHGHQHPGCLPKTHQVEDSTAESHFAKPGTRTREAGSAACIPKLPEKVREDGMLTCDRLYQ
ncbi:mCG4208 [Mus musculus]|nr:mCG4208 [Mus musculus]